MQTEKLIQKVKSGPSGSRLSQFSNRGQAIVEYVLVLVVVVALALALMRTFYRPFADFTTNFLGEYLQCILETGDLMNNSGESASGECANKFSAGAADKFRNGNGSGSRSGNGSEDGKDQGNAGKDGSSNDSEVNADADGGSRGGRSGRRGGAGGGGGNRIRFVSRGQPGTTSVSEVGANQENVGGVVAINGGKYRNYGRRGIVRIKRIRATGIGGAIAAEKEAIKKKEQKTKVVAKVSEEMDVATNNKKLKVKAVNRNIAKATQEIEPISIGKWLRYLLMAAIIIAIVVFLFLQFNSIAKSWEK